MEDLIHTRDLLTSTLYQSKQIDFEIQKTSTNLSRIHQTIFPSLETGVRNMASQCAAFAIRDHLHPTVSAALNVYQLVNGLGPSLVSAHSPSELTLYLSRLKRFRQALSLLTRTCKLAILWVEDLKTLHLLEELRETEERCLRDEGIVGVAFGVLQGHFRDLLIKLPSFPVVLPFGVVDNLKAIVAACGDGQCVSSIYVEIRTAAVETSLQGLNLDYLESDFDSVQDIQGQWGRDLEFVVTHVLEPEYTLCEQVFGQLDCFSKIALRSGITQRFIKFGNKITNAKNEAIKLFNLLDVFTALHNLRQDFNTLFGGKKCLEIRTQTRDLVKKVVNGAVEIFHNLSAQVEFQRLMDPPPDGSLPRLVTFVTEYAEELLSDDYKVVLDEVLGIHCNWQNASKGLDVAVEVQNIIKSLEVNLETWAKRYKDAALGCIFMMNVSCYMSKCLKGSRVGDLMGESWLKRNEDRVEYYSQLYLRESWGKMVRKNEGISDAFEQECRKQSGWVLCDRSLRWKTWQLIVGVMVPHVYKSSSVDRLENMVTSMLHPKQHQNNYK